MKFAFLFASVLFSAVALAQSPLLPVPAALLHRMAGDLADELLLGGQRVLPGKVAASGFEFRHPGLRDALSALLGTRAAPSGHSPRHGRKPRYFGGRAGKASLSLPSSMAVLAARHVTSGHG